MIEILWWCVVFFFGLGLTCKVIAQDSMYYLERKWLTVGICCFVLMFLLGGTAMYLTSKVCEDPKVVWDRCYRSVSK